MIKLIIVNIVTIFVILSCTQSDKYDFSEDKENLKQLSDKQASIIATIGNEKFYKVESRFKGMAVIDPKGLKISLKDQFNGNVIISIEGENWYKTKPYRVNFKDGYPTGTNAGSFLIGKISDIVNNVGEGYILMNGFFEIKCFDQSAFILIVEGDLKSPFGDAPPKKVSAKILWKNPELSPTKIDFSTIAIPLI